MCSIIRKLIFFTGILLGMLPSTHAADNNSVADAYLAAYTGQDLEALTSFYTPESVFDDPTSEGFWGQRFRVVGGDGIVQAMRENWGAIHGFRFEIRERFAFHDRVVFKGVSHLTLDGSMIGATTGKDYEFALEAVTILQIKDGKVIEHLDFYDYAPLRDV